MNRREFLHMMGLFSGTALLSSCGSDKGQKELISYLVPPEDGVVPGKAVWYTSTCTECPAGCGLQVRVREGWPVKLEGVPDHPISSGGLCIRGQASLWRLYHPDRLKTPVQRTENGDFRELSWEQAYGQILAALEQSRSEGIPSYYLSGRTTGAVAELEGLFCRESGVEMLPRFELYHHSALRMSYDLLFGRKDVPRFDFRKADLLVTFGADLFETFLSPVDFAAQFAGGTARHDFTWYHLEPHCSLTGTNAHHRLVLRPGSEPALLAFMLRSLNGEGRFRGRLPGEIAGALPVVSAREATETSGIPADRIGEILKSLEAAKRPVVIIGGVGTAHTAGLEAGVLAGLLQWLIGMDDGRFDFNRAENYRQVGSLLDLKAFSGRLAENQAGVFFCAGTNPLYQLPAEFRLAENLGRARLRVGLTDFVDETAARMDILLPLSHSLESWGDAEPRIGIRTLIRPAVGPLHSTRSEGEILFDLLKKQEKLTAYENYREYLFSRWSLHHEREAVLEFATRGYLVEAPSKAQIGLDAAAAAGFLQRAELRPAEETPLLIVAPSIRAYDGRSRVIPLLSEVPDPLTTISYGPWVSISPEEAGRHKLADKDGAQLGAGSGWKAVLPVKVQPGLPEQVLVIQRDHLDGAPFTVDPQTGEAIAFLSGATLKKTGKKVKIPILAGSFSQEGRGIIPDPVHLQEHQHRELASLYPEHPHDKHRWGMAVDLSLCIGCGACVAACYIENNVPVVGPRDHLRGREMSWLRIEPFYDGAGRVEFIPMLCQHCHKAPCEPVCPVYAAYHNPEGLNVQIYNRCVGTRYCSNNCPYKVRRFNWWTHRRQSPLDRMLNPDLSVRTKGVMEKCTFCIQRIRAAKDRAKDEGRALREGEFTTACAQSCPTGAIVFGDLADEQSRVFRLSREEGSYRVFAELGTDPAVYYLKRRGKTDE